MPKRTNPQLRLFNKAITSSSTKKVQRQICGKKTSLSLPEKIKKKIIFGARSLPKRRMKWAATFESWLKQWSTRKISELFRSWNLNFKVYQFIRPWELCSSAKWLPKFENSRFIQITFRSTSAKNVVYTEFLCQCLRWPTRDTLVP